MYVLYQVDYLARAMRLEEIPMLKKQYEDHLVTDKDFWEQQEKERVRTISFFKLLRLNTHRCVACKQFIASGLISPNSCCAVLA